MNIELFSMVQRYKFESKSQRIRVRIPCGRRCFQWSKDTNLKANHNAGKPCTRMIQVVFNGPKIQI